MICFLCSLLEDFNRFFSIFCLRWMLIFHEFLKALRAHASLNFDKVCKRRTCISYCKNQWKSTCSDFLRFQQICFKNWFPCVFAPRFPFKIFNFFLGAIYFFRSNFRSEFSWFGLQFGSQNPPGGLPGGIPKKSSILTPTFPWFLAVLALPWTPKIAKKC